MLKYDILGDSRVNEQPNLAVMHTLFLREHNRVARQLQKINPKWNDETLFQETRRIVVAEWQHIVYNEWLPLILGQDNMKRFGLFPLTKGFSNSYKTDFDPRIHTGKKDLWFHQNLYKGSNIRNC